MGQIHIEWGNNEVKKPQKNYVMTDDEAKTMIVIHVIFQALLIAAAVALFIMH